MEWTRMDGPRDVDYLGVHYGYVWYRIETKELRAKRRSLFLPDCEDRATLFLNGSPVGVWGRGPGAKRVPISAPFKRGVSTSAPAWVNARACSGTFTTPSRCEPGSSGSKPRMVSRSAWFRVSKLICLPLSVK